MMDEIEFKDRFLTTIEGWVPERADLMAHHAWRVAEKNEVMNLTRITEPEEMARKHALDSIAALPILEGTDEVGVQRVLDLGTGAGYPGLALAIAMPDLEVVLLDGRRKKIDFLTELVAELGLENQVTCVWSRFEDYIRPERRRINLVMARAVGPLARLLDWTTNRYFGPMLLWKGPAFEEELQEAAAIMQSRKLEVALDLAYEIPGEEIPRRLVLIDWALGGDEQHGDDPRRES